MTTKATPRHAEDGAEGQAEVHGLQTLQEDVRQQQYQQRAGRVYGGDDGCRGLAQGGVEEKGARTLKEAG